MKHIASYLDSLKKDSKRCLYDATKLQDIVDPPAIPQKLKELELQYSTSNKYPATHLKTVTQPDSPFIDESIIKMINFKDGYQYHGDSFTLNVFSSDEFIIPFHRIESSLQLLKPTKHIQLTFWETLAKKRIYNRILGGKDVNSGSSNTLSGEIQLWRGEEFNKVLIHELVHITSSHFFDVTQVNKFIMEHFNIKGKLVPFEAFTEWLALLLHCSFESYELTQSNSLVDNLLYNEYLFNLSQCCHLMRHYHMNTWEDMLSKVYPWEQHTDLFSYFVLKCALLSDSNYWFERQNNWMACHQENEFINWLKHALRKEGKFVRDIKTALKEKLRPSWTLRMTATELI